MQEVSADRKDSRQIHNRLINDKLLISRTYQRIPCPLRGGGGVLEDDMPRTRQTIPKTTPIIAQGWNGNKMVKRGRSPKAKKDFNDVTIVPVLNGYIINSTTTGKEVYVFEDLEKVFEFIRVKLKPTAENAEFLKGI